MVYQVQFDIVTARAGSRRAGGLARAFTIMLPTVSTPNREFYLSHRAEAACLESILVFRVGAALFQQAAQQELHFNPSTVAVCVRLQPNLYISIVSGPGGAMLLKRLCIYTGFKYAIIAIVPKSGQQGQC